MAASTITRAALTNGSTPWNVSTISSAIYDKIDEMFGGVGTYATLELGGALKINGALTQLTNDGGALGTSSLGWSDLFLASGGVINWNNGDVTITHSTNTLTFAGAASGYIFNDGNVGIGTTSPNKAGFARALTIESSGQTGLEIVGSQTTDAAIGNLVWINAAASNAYMGQISVRRDGANNSGALTFSTWNAGTGAERMRIDNSGNVGIGVTPGSVKLDIVGLTDAVRIASNTTNATTKEGKFLIRHYTNSEEDFLLAYGYSTATDNGIAFGGGSASQNAATLIGFYTAANNTTVAGTERMRINSSGHIGIAAAARLYLDGVAGTGDTYILEPVANRIDIVTGGSAHLFNTTGFAAAAYPTTASAANLYSSANGDYIYRSTSSIRFKHDITTLDTTDALSAVMAMRPVTYRGKTDADQRRYVGFIAEEMQQWAPLLCTYDDGGESGTPNYVTYDRVTAYLVAVVQQQQQKIAALEARIH